jgi:hypothetical protein
MNSKLQIGKGFKIKERTGKNQLIRWRSALNWSALYEDDVCVWWTGLLTKITNNIWGEVIECQQACAPF